jgi:sigma-B regulation protein RsbU (phosphoserine phosphatase)
MNASDPARMMAEANRQYPLTEDGNYFTLWIGSFDRRTRQLRYTTAGHGGALIQRQSGTVEWLTHTQLPLGFESDTLYELTAIQIADGDRVLLMSDGIYEAPAPTGELWGTTRLEATLMAHRAAPLGEALPALMAEAERWHGSPVFPDDAALLGLEFRL